MKRWTPDDISKLKRLAQDYPAAKMRMNSVEAFLRPG